MSSVNWVTPDLARNPGLALDTYNTKQPDAAAPILSYAYKGVAVNDAINDHVEGNGTQSFWARVGGNTINALSWLGKPLKEIQRDYKFTHAVYQDHGFLQGFAVTLGVIGGGVAGTFVGGPLGTAIGADLAATGLRKLSTVGNLGNIYSDSYAKSEDENYKVSPGRDFSNALSKATSAVGLEAASKAFKDTNAGIGKAFSGGGDTVFDIVSDPLNVVARFAQLTKAGKLVKLGNAGELELKYPIMDTVPGVKNFLTSRTGVALTSEQMDTVYRGGLLNTTSATYNRALEDIAKSNAGEIIQKYPQLGTVAAGRLGQIDKAEDVHNFLKTSLYFGDLQGTLAGQAILPSRTLLRAKVGDSRVIDYLRNSDTLPGKVYKTFSGYMPYSVDAETQKLSYNKFRWDAPDSANVVYRIGRIGLGDKASKMWATKYAESVAVGDIATARSIKNQTIFDAFKALGLPDDGEFVKSVWDDIQKVDQPLVGTQIYGTDVLGNPLGDYASATGRKVAGLAKHQAQDMFDIPDFLKIKRAMRDVGTYGKVMGPVDDFVAKYYTNAIFKPLALATAGFGLRVAAAEMIPTFARFGVLNTFKSKLAVAAAKQNYDLAPKEAGNILSAALVGLGAHTGISPDVMLSGFPAFQEAKRKGLNFAAKMLPDEQLELATRVVLANNGHFLSEAVQTGHGYDANTSFLNNTAAHYYYQIQKNGPLYRDLPEYTTYSPSDIHYAPRYTTNLNKASKETSNQNITSDLLKAHKGNKLAIDPETMGHEEFQTLRQDLINKEYARMVATTKGQYKPYAEERNVLSRWKDGNLQDFASDRVDSTLGLVVGKDGTVHTDIAKNIVNGQETDLNTIANMVKTNQKSMPAGVAGPALQPYIPAKNPLTYVTNIGFKKVIDPIVNGLAREPLYMMHVGDAYGRMAHQVAKGWITEDQALRFAQTQASYAMLPQIHNTALRNQFAQLTRNLLPFYFAQEQALKRAFSALKDTSIISPLFSRGMRFYQLSEHALSDPTFVTEDENGNRYLNIPFVGEFGKAVQGGLAAYNVPIVSGLPITAKGSLVSLKSVLPELQTPGVSPIVAVSGNLLADWFPALKPAVKGTIGDISYQRDFVDTLLPAAWLKTTISALSPVDINNQMNNALSSALASAYYNNQVPEANSSDWDRQNFVDRIKNNARSILMIKAFLNLTSPLAPQVSQEDSGFRDEFWKLVKTKGNFGDALQEFMANHGSRVVSYTVAKTDSALPGFKVPYVQDTLNFIKENGQSFNPTSGVSTGYFYLIPQDNSGNESDRSVYNDLVNQHLRIKRTPEELLRQFYVSQGDAMMGPLIKEHVANLNQAANISYLTSMEKTRWSGVIEKMKNVYPIWYNDYTSPDKRTNAGIAVNQLQSIFSEDNKNQPKHEQAVLVKDLLNKYNSYAAQNAQFKMLNIQGFASQQNKQDWEDYLLARAEEEPRLKTIIYSVFMKLG